MTGVVGYDREHGELLQAIAAGQFQGLEKLVTKKIDLEDLVEQGIKSLINEKDTQSELSILSLRKPPSYIYQSRSLSVARTEYHK